MESGDGSLTRDIHGNLKRALRFPKSREDDGDGVDDPDDASPTPVETRDSVKVAGNLN